MKPRNKLVVVMVTLAAGAALAAWAHKNWPVPAAARKRANPVASTPAVLAAAKKIYVDKCEQCHADKGTGDGPMAMMYSVKPADFTDQHMMSEMTDGELFYKISEGREPMPGFKNQYTEEQRWQLVHYVRALSAAAKAKAPAKKPAKASPHKH
jgi:mono/diheme cytochrome c family protein